MRKLHIFIILFIFSLSAVILGKYISNTSDIEKPYITTGKIIDKYSYPNGRSITTHGALVKLDSGESVIVKSRRSKINDIVNLKCHHNNDTKKEACKIIE